VTGKATQQDIFSGAQNASRFIARTLEFRPAQRRPATAFNRRHYFAMFRLADRVLSKAALIDTKGGHVG
jgi:hypothetical protein